MPDFPMSGEIAALLQLMKAQGVGAFKIKTDELELEVAFSGEAIPLPLPPEDIDDREPTDDELQFYSSR